MQSHDVADLKIWPDQKKLKTSSFFHDQIFLEKQNLFLENIKNHPISFFLKISKKTHLHNPFAQNQSYTLRIFPTLLGLANCQPPSASIFSIVSHLF